MTGLVTQGHFGLPLDPALIHYCSGALIPQLKGPKKASRTTPATYFEKDLSCIGIVVQDASIQGGDRTKQAVLDASTSLQWS